RGSQREGNPGVQCPGLWHGRGGTVCHCAAFGNLPPYRRPFGGGTPGALGTQYGLVLLGLSADGAGGKNPGNYWIWKNRAEDWHDREGPRHGGAGVQPP